MTDYEKEQRAKEKAREKEIKELVAKRWKFYKKCNAEKKQKLVDHTFKLVIDDVGSGWEYIHWELDGANVNECRISDVGTTVHGLFYTLQEMGPQDVQEIVFCHEPGESSCIFARRNDIICIELPGMDKAIYLQFEYFMNQIEEEFYRWYKY